MLFAGQIFAARTYDYFTIYTVVFLLYLAVGYPAIRLVMLLEKRVKAGYAGRRKLIVTPTGDVATLEVAS
jgi:polar amino acid transport system permease protein